MALLDRVKDRLETDLSDAELILMINEADQEIIRRFGPRADPDMPITITVDGDERRTLDLIRPIDTDQPCTITETEWDETPTLLIAGTDYLVLNGGRTLQRLRDAPNARWASTVSVTYVPFADGNQRQEVIIGLVQLAVERHGVKSRKAGDLAVETLDYPVARDKLLASLAPRRGLFVR